MNIPEQENVDEARRLAATATVADGNVVFDDLVGVLDVPS